MAFDLTNPYSMATSPIASGGTVDYTNPDWYNQFMQNVAGAGNTLTAGPSTPGSIAYNTQNWYSAPLTGQWNPNLAAAGTAAAGAAGPGGYLTQAGNMVTGAAGNISNASKALGATSGTLGGISTNIGNLAPSYTGIGNNLGGISSDISGIASKIPGMTTYAPGALTQFMNPYTNDAAQATINLSNKNLFENVMPGVNSTFTGAGQFGSTRNADFMNRAIRDQQQTLSNTIGGLNYGAVTQAQQAMKDWANLRLSGASTALGAEGQRAGIAGQQAGLVGQQASLYGQQAGISGQQMTAEQQQAANAQAEAALGNQIAGLGDRNIQNLSGTGASYLDWQNKGLGANYQDYLQQLQYPTQALGALSQVGGMLKGAVQPSQSVTPGEMTPQQKAAMLVQLAGTMGSSGTLSDLQSLWNNIFGSSPTA